MPLTVDMQATFDSVFALIRNAESMDRLVRVASVRVMCKREFTAESAESAEKTSRKSRSAFSASSAVNNPLESDRFGSPILKASVGLEAIYEPPAGQEGK